MARISLVYTNEWMLDNALYNIHTSILTLRGEKPPNPFYDTNHSLPEKEKQNTLDPYHEIGRTMFLLSKASIEIQKWEKTPEFHKSLLLLKEFIERDKKSFYQLLRKQLQYYTSEYHRTIASFKTEYRPDNKSFSDTSVFRIFVIDDRDYIEFFFDGMKYLEHEKYIDSYESIKKEWKEIDCTLASFLDKAIIQYYEKEKYIFSFPDEGWPNNFWWWKMLKEIYKGFNIKNINGLYFNDS